MTIRDVVYCSLEKADFLWDSFERSLPMSTYVVAFIVTDMAHRTADPALSETPFRGEPDHCGGPEYAGDHAYHAGLWCM